MTVEQDFELRVAELGDAGLLRRPRLVRGAGPRITVDGHPAVCFCSNDYLGLASHPRLVQLTSHAQSDEGTVGAGASRLITGTRAAHLAAERRLATLVGRPAALLFSSGYAANIGALSALIQRGDVVYSDALNHASLIDGIRLSRGEAHVYPHNDLGALRTALEAHASGRAWIVTDAVFSMDGDRADLRALRSLADEFDAALYVDEAHSLGVISAAGACSSSQIAPDVLIGTLGKAFGVSGAFVAGSHALRTLLENRARSYVFSTAPPPALAEAILIATDLVAEADERRATVLRHADRLRTGLRAAGWTVPESDTQIVPVLVGAAEETMRLSSHLLDAGYFVRGIRPPTVQPGTSRLRVVPTALHTDSEVDGLVHTLRDARLHRASWT
ncbi:MAG: aminotransferase class I/II-fold pyridoxal phosphate-dependent enzyme [Sandaracinaceae bacterium]